MPDPTDLTALPGEQLLSDLINAVAADALEHRQPVLTRPTLALRTELLRRLRQWDALAMGPVDPPTAPPA